MLHFLMWVLEGVPLIYLGWWCGWGMRGWLAHREIKLGRLAVLVDLLPKRWGGR